MPASPRNAWNCAMSVPAMKAFAAGSAKHRCAQPIFPADLRASLAELLVHAPGHGVARGRPVEDRRGDLAVASVAHLPIGHRTAPNVATAIVPITAACAA